MPPTDDYCDDARVIQDNLSVADGGALTKSCLTMNCVKSQVPASLSLHSVGVRPIEVEPS